MSVSATSRRRAVRWIVAVAVVVAVAAVAWMGIRQRFTIQDTGGPLRLETIPVNGVLTFTVDGSPKDDERISHRQLWPVVVNTIEYERPPIVYDSLAGPFEDPLPGPGRAVWISIDRSLEIRNGVTYLAIVDRPPRPAGSEVPWSARVILDVGTGDVVGGTDPELARDLNTITLKGETRGIALVEWAREFAGVLNARASGDPNATGPRVTLLAEADMATAIQPVVDAYRSSDPTITQLPGELDLPDSVASAVADELGIGTWEPWSIYVLYDATDALSIEWLALFIEGFGYIGPYQMDPTDRVMALNGYGPGSGTLSLMTWSGGEPAEPSIFAGRPVEGAVRAAFRPIENGLIDDSARSLLGSNGSVLIDMRGDSLVASVLAADEIQTLLTDLVHPTGLSGEESE